jgi:hypothetical protein
MEIVEKLLCIEWAGGKTMWIEWVGKDNIEHSKAKS